MREKRAREVEKMLRAAIEKNRVEFGRTIKRLKKQRDKARHTVSHLEAVLEEEGIDSSAIEQGECVFEVQCARLESLLRDWLSIGRHSQDTSGTDLVGRTMAELAKEKVD